MVLSELGWIEAAVPEWGAAKILTTHKIELMTCR
ncbi:hypothetical protein COL8621_00582 [Actibacterium lipolyticum]|uniref:Uncharacterized protein n=1 Tax=Actibacterium lipolyticum TaxID=1524263 RepID=A0A238JMK2_9RHOB|nr:hypothetical protein COL8621_00582 [Actibacterium lipolyticum]